MPLVSTRCLSLHKNQAMNTPFRALLEHRRSIRNYLPEQVPDDVIKRCIESATLAPSSSNLQLWEYYHVKSKDKKAALVKACMSQPAAKTAPNLIVVVTRHDYWKRRCDANLDFFRKVAWDEPDDKPIRASTYFTKTIPALYFDFLGIFGVLKKVFSFFQGLRRPMFREVRASQVLTMSHKSVGLGAVTLMYALAAEGYDSCPMEGMDSKRVRKILDLPKGAKINMVISCGKRAEGGVYGPRFRLPIDEVFFEV